MGLISVPVNCDLGGQFHIETRSADNNDWFRQSTIPLYVVCSMSYLPYEFAYGLAVELSANSANQDVNVRLVEVV